MNLSDYRIGPVMAVSDMERAKEFYEGKLGLSPDADANDDTRSYPCADGTGVFVYLSPQHAGKSTATLAGWAVDDLEQVVEELTANGVSFEQYDMAEIKTDQRGIFEADGVKVAWIRDPDGNTIAINEAPA
jgi:catechol 2,3-dioxygenase-like lactoylglutathione lyase family enzyme